MCVSGCTHMNVFLIDLKTKKESIINLRNQRHLQGEVAHGKNMDNLKKNGVARGRIFFLVGETRTHLKA